MLIDDDAVECIHCGWCGYEHLADVDCGCKPCADCDDYHDGSCR